MKFGLAYTLACVGGLLLGGGAKAADVYSPVTPETQKVVTEKGWTFSVAPYFWAAQRYPRQRNDEHHLRTSAWP